MYFYVSKIYARGIFLSFPWWLKNVKNVSKIAPFSNERHLRMCIAKKTTIEFFRRKLSKLYEKIQFLCDNYIFPETRANKNKQGTWTVVSLTVPGGQEFHFPHFFLKFQSIFLIFPQTSLIFFLILALRVGDSPTRKDPGYATAGDPLLCH